MLDSFDIGFALRQTAIIAAIIVFPWVAFAAIGRSPALGRQVCAGALVTWMLLFGIVLWTSARVWAASDVPYSPLPIGPSYLSVLDIARVVAITTWTPAAIVFALTRWRRSSLRLAQLAGPWILPFLVVAGGWTALFLGVLEYAHEDTIYAPGFSIGNWNQIRDGMTQNEVIRLLGPPLPEHLQPRFARDAGALCWARNWSAGYFATVWFDQERVARVQLWYSD